MLECGVNFSSHFPRLPKFRACLDGVNEREDAQKVLTRIIEYGVDPKHFKKPHARYGDTIIYLNKFLKNDNLELREHADRMQLYSIRHDTGVAEDLVVKAT